MSLLGCAGYGRYFALPLCFQRLSSRVSTYRSYWGRFVILQISHPSLRLLADLGVTSLIFYVQLHDIVGPMSWTLNRLRKLWDAGMT
jgi:hypothetical protein